MSSEPFFSIIVPTYNRLETLPRLLSSIKDQDFREIEVIIVDDSSNDGTIQYLRTQKTYECKIIALGNRSGPNIAKNTGSFSARGKWLIFMDSDDAFIAKDSIKKIYNCIKTAEADIVFTVCLDQNGKHTVRYPKFSGYAQLADFINGNVQGEYLPTVQRETFLRYYFFTDIWGGEGLTWTMMLKDKKRAFVSNEITRRYYTDRSDRLSNKHSNARRIAMVISKEISLYWSIYLNVSPNALLKKILKLFYYKAFLIVHRI